MIGQYLKQKRLEVDITQAQLARALKCKPQHVCNIEREVCPVPKPMLKKWIKTIGLNKKDVVSHMVNKYEKEIKSYL